MAVRGAGVQGLLDFIVSLRLAWAMQDPVLKKKKKKALEENRIDLVCAIIFMLVSYPLHCVGKEGPASSLPLDKELV